MTISILIGIWSMVILNITEIIYGRMVKTHNAEVWIRNEREMLEKIIDLKKANKELDATCRELAGKAFSDLAFIISTDGVKALPADWRERMK
jgi:hypothetical protein